MICQTCKKENQKSTVRSSYGSVTLRTVENYWDEDGNYHAHNPNLHSLAYTCSRGHKWDGSYYPMCPAGDYGGPA